jgi:hypothetical protein
VAAGVVVVVTGAAVAVEEVTRNCELRSPVQSFCLVGWAGKIPAPQELQLKNLHRTTQIERGIAIEEVHGFEGEPMPTGGHDRPILGNGDVMEP